MIYRCTYGIIFLGTPHRGSNATAWAEILEKMASFALHETNSMIIEELKANSPTLLNISRAFARMLADREIYIASFVEELPMAGVGLVSSALNKYNKEYCEVN